MIHITGVTQVKSPDQVPQGPHFLVVVFTEKEVMVNRGGWEADWTRTQLPITELYVTQDQAALTALIDQLRREGLERVSILAVSNQGHLTQSVSF